MEGSSQNLGVDSNANQKTFEAVQRRKLESAPNPDTTGAEAVEDFTKQIATHDVENSPISDCQSSSFATEVTPQEFALSIDDVFEQVLSSLDHTSLLTCRLVSRRWRLSSTRVIQDRSDVNIIFKYSPTDQVYVKQRTAAEADAADKSTLQNLTSFLKGNYWPRGPFKMEEFPCETFDFVDGSLSDPQLQSFLTTFGEYILDLLLDFSDSSEGENEATLIKKIGHLLNTQAPYLCTLYLYPSLKLAVAETDDSPNGVLTLADTGLPPSNQNDQESKKMWRKLLGKSNLLRWLHFQTCPRKTLDYIISISPNLREISIDCQNYHFLSSPLNRLHFLKEFEFSVAEDEIFDFEKFKLFEAALCVPNEERESQKLPPIKFNELSMDFDNIHDLMTTNADIRICFVRVINKILELSWDTLESISLVNHEKNTLTGLKWPRVFPKVRKLDLHSGVVAGSGLELFPWSGNFKIEETFPNLKRLKFDEVIDYDGGVPILSAGKFLRNCDFGPAPSVKFVEVRTHLYLNDDDVCFNIDVARDVERFQLDVTNSLVRLFPSAELTIKDDVYN